MRLLESPPEMCWSPTDGEHVWQMGELGTAAMLLGIAEAALDLIVDYANDPRDIRPQDRRLSGRRHPCADMALRAEAARCQLWYAAAAMKEGRADAGLHLDAAKHLCNQAALANADTNIQLHGGIGVTDEHNAHLLLKQAMLLGKLFGTKRGLLGRLVNGRGAGLRWTSNIPTPIDDFRARARAWLSINVPKTPRPAHGPEAAQFDRDWQRKMYRAWLGGRRLAQGIWRPWPIRPAAGHLV